MHIQVWNNDFTIVDAFLFGMNTAADNLVHRSTRCSICLPLYCFRSMATTSLNSDAIGRPTTGLAGGFLNILQMSHRSEIIRISFFKLSSFDHLSPAAFTILNRRSADGWAKHLWSFLAISLEDFSCWTFNTTGHSSSFRENLLISWFDLVIGRAYNPFVAEMRKNAKSC